MNSPVAVAVLLAGATLLLLSLGAVAVVIARLLAGRRRNDFDWGETWRGAVDEFKAAERKRPPAE